MFIYRVEAVAPMEENSGVAEIIVGKQHNGSTGSFQLAFLKQFTKLANLWQGAPE
jgi:replicative DNA helicase